MIRGQSCHRILPCSRGHYNTPLRIECSYQETSYFLFILKGENEGLSTEMIQKLLKIRGLQRSFIYSGFNLHSCIQFSSCTTVRKDERNWVRFAYATNHRRIAFSFNEKILLLSQINIFIPKWSKNNIYWLRLFLIDKAVFCLPPSR